MLERMIPMIYPYIFCITIILTFIQTKLCTEYKIIIQKFMVIYQSKYSQVWKNILVYSFKENALVHYLYYPLCFIWKTDIILHCL